MIDHDRIPAVLTIRACDDRPISPAPPPIEPGPSPEAGSFRAVFLDRDGTLIADRPYSADPDRIELLDGVIEGLALLDRAGYRLIVVTNQSGIARGYFDEAALARMHQRIDELLKPAEVSVRAFYYCPHHVEGIDPALARPCWCRKPGPGMLLRAAADWSIELPSSWLIGDRLTDCQAGERAGCRSVLLGTRPASARYPVASDLIEAARRVIASDGHARSAAGGARRESPRR
ncbi:MAG: D-glycero-alpha-D-manno-heptose-1,7-bisphosphate 7-phosphatase [Chloroflexota bacterium]